MTAKRALIVWAVLMTCAAVTGAFQEPARSERKSIRFSGYDLFVKSSSGTKVGPGPNYFSKDAVELAPDGLKLKLVQRDGLYYCGEIISQRSFGYGTYRFTLGSNIDQLAANLVLGLFTWSDEPEFSHRELDVEVSRWGDPENQNGQFVVQPYTTPGSTVRFPIPQGFSSSVYSFTWRPEEVEFRAEGPGRTIVETHKFVRRVPEAGGENARINLWLVSGRRPQPGVKEVVISKFEFLPLDDK